MKVSIRYLLFISLLFSLSNLFAQEETDSLESYSVKEFVFEDSTDFVDAVGELVDDLVGEDLELALEWDTSGIDLIRENYKSRQFDSSRLEAFKNLDEFDYTEAESEESVISRFFKRFIRKIFGDLDMNLNSKWLQYLLIAAAAILLIWFLLRNELKTFVKKKDNSAIIPQVGDLDINVSRDILQEKLDRAEQEGRYREAVRYSYLMILKKLNNENVIVWKDYKLGQDYVNEISDLETRKEFQASTDQFNYAWYGNYEVDQKFYNRTMNHNITIQKLIES